MSISFPPLPYAYDALEPYIDRATMEIHYAKHHQSYHQKLIKALDKIGTHPGVPLEKILGEISKYPSDVRENGGGHFNHVFFWESMTPTATKLQGHLKAEIERRWSSENDFRNEFSKAAKTLFGSGFVWLILDEKTKQLEIICTPNQDNPLMDIVNPQGLPLLALDVWEHAYYLKFQNRRQDYIESWWNLTNWDRAEARLRSGEL